MSDDAHPQTQLGAFVLGALDPGEAAHVREHVAACEKCQEECDRLSGAARLLTSVPPQAWAQDEAKPSELGLAAMLARMRAERKKTHRRTAATSMALGAAAASAVVAGAWGLTAQNTAPPAAGPVVRTTVAPSFTLAGSGPARGVHGHVDVVPVAWGTRLDVELDGVQRGLRCRLVVLDRSGRRWNAGSWTVAYQGSFYWSGAVAIPQDRIAAVEVVTTDGVRLLHLA